MIEEIINQGAMLNLPDVVGWTPLHIACFYKRPDVILLLLKYNVRLNVKDREGNIPLELCRDSNECQKIFYNFMKNNLNQPDLLKSNQNIMNKKRKINFSLIENQNDDEPEEEMDYIQYKNTPRKHKFFSRFMKEINKIDVNNRDIMDIQNKVKSNSNIPIFQKKTLSIEIPKVFPNLKSLSRLNSNPELNQNVDDFYRRYDSNNDSEDNIDDNSFLNFVSFQKAKNRRNKTDLKIKNKSLLNKDFESFYNNKEASVQFGTNETFDLTVE